MWKTSTLWALGGLLASTQCHPVAETSNTSPEPCAKIAELYSKYAATNSSKPLLFHGQLAYDCLHSMPFEYKLAAAFATEIKKYLQFQSTSDILSSPPAGYLSPPTNLLGGMNKIVEKAESNAYKSQYDFDNAIKTLFQSANDGHLTLLPCSSQIFQFSRSQELVSISEDGLCAPKLYTTGDAVTLLKHPHEVSAVAYIDNKPAVEYLSSTVASHQFFQDPDARYNNLFYNPSREPYQQNPQGAFYNDGGAWPGADSVTFKYENGTTEKVETIARLISASAKFGSKTGKHLFEAACVPTKKSSSSTSTASSAQSTPSTKPQARVPDYPEPVIRDQFNLISGYYVNSTAGDVAVLFIPTFSTTGSFYDETSLPDDSAVEFSKVASEFIQKAKKDGKKKIIIDVSGNNGGTFSSGEDMYKLFFPDQDIYTATRFRAHDSIDLAVKAIGALPESFLATQDTTHFDFVSYRTAVKPDQKTRFPSPQALYGPHKIGRGSYGSVYANGNLTLDSTRSTPIHGYGAYPERALGPQPYAVDDILILTDGYCLSTCASFVNLMKNFGGVKSIAFGGRPQLGPMAAVGGVKGAQSLSASALDSILVALTHQAVQNYSTALTPAEQRRFNQTAPAGLDNLPLMLASLELNFRNAYSPGDHDLPLQFVSEAADCRLFYTAETLLKPASLWAAAADAFWGHGRCVQGSTNGPGSVSAGGVAGFGEARA